MHKLQSKRFDNQIIMNKNFYFYYRTRAFLGNNSPARGHVKQFTLKPSARDVNDGALEVVRASQAISES